MMHENKYEISQRIFDFLESTRAGIGMTGIEYVPIGETYSEELIIHREHEDDLVINVSCDSGIAMMADVIKAV